MARLIKIKKINEKNKGNTFILNNLKHNVSRVYYIKNVKDKKIVRGKHKHNKNLQTLIVISGSLKIRIVNNKKSKLYFIKHTDEKNAIYLKNSDWHEMYNFSKDCVICVLASMKYDKDDYIYTS
jgi:dTDP-4-dehydrorhamnose 3,5-epimerase-like enzyme